MGPASHAGRGGGVEPHKKGKKKAHPKCCLGMYIDGGVWYNKERVNRKNSSLYKFYNYSLEHHDQMTFKTLISRNKYTSYDTCGQAGWSIFRPTEVKK